MRSFIVNKDMSGRKLVRASLMEFPSLKPSVLQKALRSRDIRVDGKRTSSDIIVSEGQEIQLWLPDALFEGGEASNKKEAKSDGKAKTVDADDYKVVMQTDDLLIVNKRQGLAVHGGKGVGDESLIDIVRRDLGRSEIDLCHRIDMNTGGLVMMAKNKDALEDAIKLFKNDLLIKRYRCLVLGVPSYGESVICDDDAIMKEVSAFLEKGTNGVFVHDVQKPGDLPITSRYRVLNVWNGVGPEGMDVSEIEVELVTGRMHQIRAQFAHLGHPILGDGNYGRNKQNFHFRKENGSKLRYQQLWATSLILRKIPRDNMHERMSGRSFEIEPRYEIDMNQFAKAFSKSSVRRQGSGATREGTRGQGRRGGSKR